ncbi:MAG: hypothetical protein QXJ74_02325 [Nitrososphaera sp.]|uniref:hypothetical protein n=1 Tax=Nitrososphaera sp. TaxID=1971748 RepID=UPI0017B1BED5|nr:hypothetical protein [Nitrososphaera sp.]NWG37596.1 hypothetical protein [Nitrososphaera sp.]
MRQDASPLPYGTLGYYQVHYIVDTGNANTEQVLARCEPMTKGHFSEKRVVAVRWTGYPAFAERLQNDSRLTELLKEVLLHEGEIRVDPLDGHVRIYGGWNHEENLQANQAMVEAADLIAGHVRAALH